MSSFRDVSSSLSVTQITCHFEFRVIILLSLKMSDLSLSVSLRTPLLTPLLDEIGLSLTAEKTSSVLFPGGLEPKKLTYIKTKTRPTQSQQKEQTRLQLANCKTR